MTPEIYFKKWSENCRLFIDYKPIHSHEDMMRFAEAYHKEQLKLSKCKDCREIKDIEYCEDCYHEACAAL